MTVVSQRCLAAVMPIVLWTPLAASAATCPLEVVGTWKRTDAAEISPSLITFAGDGWVNVLSGAGQGTPGDIAAQVRYQLAPPQDPRRIDFQTPRGNDVFHSGTSSWEITAYTDESFTARRTDSVDGAQSLWARVQTQRYFLTLAARKGAATRDAATFVMWTTLDGRRMVLDALGAFEQGTERHFGRIPHALAKEFATQGDPTRDVMMRIELSEAEYRRTRAVYKDWNAVPDRNTPAADADSRALKLIDATVQSVNRCAARIRSADALAVTQGARPAQPQELVRMIRSANDRRHVPDKAFPFRWKPPELS